MKILIVEDEQRLSNSISDYLSQEGYLCEQAFTFNDAKIKIGVYQYDCVLLDLMLPGGNGLDLLRTLRSKQSDTGVIIISAKGSIDDKVTGLEIGSDDYLAKPFALSELAMRIYALIRRQRFSVSNVVTSGNINVNLLNHTVTVDGKPLSLTKTEYELLLFFISNRDHVVSKSAIAEHLTGEMADMLDNFDFIYSHIKNLKSKLSHAGCPDSIKTIYGTGYKWVK